MGWTKKTTEFADGDDVNWDEESEFEGELVTIDWVDTKYGEKRVYRFRAEDGSIRSVWGAAKLDAAMKDLEEGTRVRIEYKGLVKTRGGNRAHDFDVMVWDDEDGDDKPARRPAKKAPAKKAASSRRPAVDDEPY